MKGFMRGLCFIFTATLTALFTSHTCPMWIFVSLGMAINICALFGWKD